MTATLSQRFRVWRYQRQITQQRAALLLAAMDYATLLYYQDHEPELAEYIRQLARFGLERRGIVNAINRGYYASYMGDKLQAAIRAAVREARGQ